MPISQQLLTEFHVRNQSAHNTVMDWEHLDVVSELTEYK
jgi:hypothetical protein